MVRLKAKGMDPYVEANLPTHLAEVESTIVLGAVRDAVDAVVGIASSSAGASTEAGLSQLVVLKRMVESINKESEEMLLLLSVVEQRLMEIG